MGPQIIIKPEPPVAWDVLVATFNERESQRMHNTADDMEVHSKDYCQFED